MGTVNARFVQILGANPADRVHRHRQIGDERAESSPTKSCLTRMRRRRMDRPEYGQVRANACRMLELTAGMAGSTDPVDHRPSTDRDKLSGAQMHAVGPHRASQLDIAVDQDARTSRMASRDDFCRQGLQPIRRHGLLAQLDQAQPRCESRIQTSKERRLAARRRIGDRVLRGKLKTAEDRRVRSRGPRSATL